VQSFYEAIFTLDAAQGGRAHARHQTHIDDYVRAIGHFDAATCIRRADRAHTIRDDIHRASTHRALEERVHLTMRLIGGHPIVIRPRRFFRASANEREMFYSRNVGRMRSMQIAAWMSVFVELYKTATREKLGDQRIVLFIATCAPVH
jgi:hypothetical protein